MGAAAQRGDLVRPPLEAQLVEGVQPRQLRCGRLRVQQLDEERPGTSTTGAAAMASSDLVVPRTPFQQECDARFGWGLVESDRASKFYVCGDERSESSIVCYKVRKHTHTHTSPCLSLLSLPLALLSLPFSSSSPPRLRPRSHYCLVAVKRTGLEVMRLSKGLSKGLAKGLLKAY